MNFSSVEHRKKCARRRRQPTLTQVASCSPTAWNSHYWLLPHALDDFHKNVFIFCFSALSLSFNLPAFKSHTVWFTVEWNVCYVYAIFWFQRKLFNSVNFEAIAWLISQLFLNSFQFTQNNALSSQYSELWSDRIFCRNSNFLRVNKWGRIY